MTQKKDDEFTSWIGTTQTSVDQITRSPLSLLAATLDREEGACLQVPWSWFYFLPNTPTEELGVDGHPSRQGFLPPITLPRRDRKSVVGKECCSQCSSRWSPYD